MPRKYQIISELASQTARDITSKAERYTDFLVTAANNYKYSFKEQLLIHAQKPDATACAEIETWNRLGRWVNKGTRGIALLVDRDTPYKLRHVFDYSDTNSRAGRVVTLWQMRPQYEDAVKESLQDSFGEVELTADFPHFLMEIAKNAVEDIMFINDKKPVPGNMFTEKFGTHQCLLAARENVMRVHHTTVDDAIINRVFRFGTADINEKYLKTITDTATEYVEGIFQRLREHEYNPELMRLYVLGGGSCLIRNFGTFDKGRVTINDDICATAKGYEHLAELNLRRGGAA